MRHLSFYTILFAVLATLLVNCKNKEKTATTETEEVEEVQETTEEMAETRNGDSLSVTVDRSYHFRETDPYDIDSIWMAGDTIHIKVQYGGGCEEHEFKLMTNGDYAKSMPPQMTLHLEHENNNDRCRALIMKELKFDLKPIRNPSAENLLIRINGLQNDPVTYSYNR
ncbi:hypothetical protein [Halocola ammonii]